MELRRHTRHVLSNININYCAYWANSKLIINLGVYANNVSLNWPLCFNFDEVKSMLCLFFLSQIWTRQWILCTYTDHELVYDKVLFNHNPRLKKSKKMYFAICRNLIHLQLIAFILYAYYQIYCFRMIHVSCIENFLCCFGIFWNNNNYNNVPYLSMRRSHPQYCF